MIEIHLDGKPVTKLQAARALNRVGSGNHVCICEPGARDWDRVVLRGRYHAYGEVQPPELSCMSFSAGTPAGMRLQAQMITLAAEIAELAEMIVAEQDGRDEADDDLTGKCAGHGGEGPSGPGCPDCAAEDECRQEGRSLAIADGRA